MGRFSSIENLTHLSVGRHARQVIRSDAGGVVVLACGVRVTSGAVEVRTRLAGESIRSNTFARIRQRPAFGSGIPRPALGPS
jgi:hypothetical protein